MLRHWSPLVAKPLQVDDFGLPFDLVVSPFVATAGRHRLARQLQHLGAVCAVVVPVELRERAQDLEPAPREQRQEEDVQEVGGAQLVRERRDR